MAVSYPYSFSAVTIVIQLTDTVGSYTEDTQITLNPKGFFDKNDSIRITPQAEYITGEAGAGGEDYVSVTNDETGTAVLNVGDMTPAHQILAAVANGHKQGLNVKGITMTVTRNAINADGKLLYKATYGSIQNRAPEKGYGANQTGNSYQLRFESIIHDIEGIDS